MRILWASPNTLLDTTNGAALMVCECLRQLAMRGCDVHILSSTSFVNVQGMSGRSDLWNSLRDRIGSFVDIKEDILTHRVLITEQTRRRWMRSYEEQMWFDEYRRILELHRPDFVLFFDKSLLALLTTDEARRMGIPVGVFLMHGNNTGQHWCRDVNWMFTDTRATAEMYRKREGYDIIPVGTFVEPEAVRVPGRQPKNLLFINPIPAKGGVLMVQVALWLLLHRPDVSIEVVDSRKTWKSILAEVTAALGNRRDGIPNVEVTPNVLDMRPIYERTRLLVVPSLWWESGPRVIVEALINGIPVVAANSGGIAEVLGKGGQLFDVPGEYREAPYMRLFPESFVKGLAECLLRYVDDQEYYQKASTRSRDEHRLRHNLQQNGDGLLTCLRQCLQMSAQVMK